MNRSPFTSRKATSAGFSLIEIAIAVGILAVVLVSLIGMMPGGLTNFRKAMDTSITAQIAQRIVNDLEQAEFNQVIDLANLPKDPSGKSYCKANFSFRWPRVTPNAGEPTLRFFDDQGAELLPPTGKTTLSTDQQRNMVYTANIRILPRAAIPTKNNNGGAVAQATVQIARNPSGLNIPIVSAAPDDANTPERNLFRKTTGVQIYTYYALIGNNQGK
jgi:hypothetical protein